MAGLSAGYIAGQRPQLFSANLNSAYIDTIHSFT